VLNLNPGNFTTGAANAFKTDLSWKDPEFPATTSGLPVIAKGITRPEDALAAVKAGAAAVQVSNHGACALDGTPASIMVLPRVADAMQGSAPIVLDSGIRRGMDVVVSALARGANAGRGRAAGVVGAHGRRPGRRCGTDGPSTGSSSTSCCISASRRSPHSGVSILFV
jgi:isopentenyl diphosphate isomerase/L-lactate dehydrogenase-like FMN-dependent dehydrogenase